MEIKEHFEDIEQIIVTNLLKAKQDIQIAVAWFTNYEIFKIIVKKAVEIPIHLIVINDDINNRIGGLDFQKFIDAGGLFYFGKQETPMHNKFCIIDEKILISGSYNYTYLAEKINNENIIVFNGTTEILQGYRNEFLKIISKLNPILSVSEYLKNNPYKKDIFSFKNYGVRDIYAQTQLLKKQGNTVVAFEILRKLENVSKLLTNENFQIKDIIYKQWRQNFFTDKIQVLKNQLILYFRCKVEDDGCFIHGPKANRGWIIRDSANHNLFRKANRISNIKIDGEKIISSTEIEEIIFFSHDGKFKLESNFGYKLDNNKQLVKVNGEIIPIKYLKVLKNNFELSCEIHFDINEFPLETIDLIEGLGTDKFDNHWHCFDINLRLNREEL